MAKLTKEWLYGKDISSLLLRIVLGLSMFYGHGLGKWEMLWGDGAIQFADPLGLGVTLSLGLAVFAEVICALMLVFGLFTRLALIPLIATMAVAVFIFHSGHAFAKIELSLIYLCGFISLLFVGPGRISLDHIIKR
ncbi:DoxX family protein [Brumimicrobium salinarum]|uniref:DoxX family protein n=1 Tax=Brumimicrobium salinarum TaxID=2058658 RepID=A0A2I0R483_9FLAO|nr:DoxX family protein [Brumimicrobium salinarum]PKR81200.1 DoxX family protein [Brumimicrobium salinarum]